MALRPDVESGNRIAVAAGPVHFVALPGKLGCIMHTHSLDPWRHDHRFGQHRPRAGERRVLVVVVITLAMMAVEVGAGVAFGSMALLADGLHMASHAAALGIAYGAYVYARRHAHDRRFSFGTGKVDALAGYSSALVLVLFAGIMAVESAWRLVEPRSIAYTEALLVAVVGFVVNGLCAWLLAAGGHEDEARWHAGEAEPASQHAHTHDHNLRGAYLHVLADALTSILAIVALLGGRSFGWSWLDAAVGLVGAAVVSRWAYGLIRDSARVLLDREAPRPVQEALRRAIEQDSDQLADLHVWSIGPAGYAAALTIISAAPLPADIYRARIPAAARILHATIEVHPCRLPERV
jgi:cation diffusion facilitator family transporter